MIWPNAMFRDGWIDVVQDAILFLPLTTSGRDPVREKHVRPIAAKLDWKRQRDMGQKECSWTTPSWS